MAVNKYIPHLFVIPEDDANRQMAVGFEKDHRIRPRALQIMAPAGGWQKALEKLSEEYYPILELNSNSHVLVMIDCDRDVQRIARALDEVPNRLEDRVFIIGTLTEPENLKRVLSRTLEQIGESVAQDCVASASVFWNHEELQHNAHEIARLKTLISPVVFEVN